MAGLTETKKNKNVEVYAKNSAGEVRRSGAFTPESGIVVGAAGNGSAGTLADNIKLHRGSAGLQFVKETDTTADGVTAPFANLAVVTIVSSGELIVGSAAQVTAGKATHSTLSSAIASASAGDTIYLLELSAPITEGSAITLNKRVNIIGAGNGSEISDVFVMASTASKSLIKQVKFGQDITVVTNLNVNLTTTGRPVRLQLNTGPSGGVGTSGKIKLFLTGSSSAINCKVFLYRNGTEIAVFELDKIVSTPTGSDALTISPSCIEYLDNTVAGIYSYSVSVQANSSNSNIDVTNVKLVAYEL